MLPSLGFKTLSPDRRRLAQRIGISLMLSLPCAFFAFPFLWMLFSVSKTNLEIFTPLKFFPDAYSWDAFRALLGGEHIPFVRQYANSLFIASVQSVGAVAVSATAGFVFGRYEFPFRRTLLVLAVFTVLIPRQVLVLPLFLWMHRLHLLDTPFAVILPGVVTGLGILYFTMVFRRVPGHLLDAARMEGASEYRVFRFALPLVLPSLLTYGLIHFILAWHEHIIPLVMLNTETRLTVPLALSSLYGGDMRVPYAMLMVGSLVTVLPTALLYFFLRRHFQSSLADLTSR